MSWLGLDLGTSGLKGVVIGDDEEVLAEATAPLTVSRPHDGWSEQDPADWIGACEAVLEDLGQKAELSAVGGIGLSGQMHGATLLDAAGQVLRPCILWNDTRSAAQAAALDGTAGFRKKTGNIVFPGFTAPKLAWVRDNEPEVFAKVAKVLLPKDYLRLWLTGDHVAEMSDAAGTSWLDVGARAWDADLLAATGLGLEHMPRLVEGADISGALRAGVAARFGLREGVPVAGGGGDNAASAVGVGAVTPGQGFVSIGTSGVLFVATDGFSPDPETAVHTFCHAVPETWHQMGVILSAADALNWWVRIAGDRAAALTEATGPLTAPGKAVFLPYLGGERTPHNDAAVRGHLLNLDHAASQIDLTRAVMEGVSFAFADCLMALQATGTGVDRLLAVGGGSNSHTWLEMIATTLGIPLDLPQDGDFGGAFGAARLGRMAVTGDLAAPAPPIAETIDPVHTLMPRFAEAHARYRAAYGVIKQL